MPLEWVPSATWPRSITCMRVYIRWGATGLRYGYEAKMPKKQVTTLKFPDRFLYICWQPEDYPEDPSLYDEVVDFSPFENGTVGRRMVKSVLISAHNAHDKTAIRDFQRARPGADLHDMSTWNHSGLEVLGDSGGAQLYSGRINYIDPHKVIGYFNKGVTTGMALDIPPREPDAGSDKVVHALARAQLGSNFVYEKERNDTIKLFNVVHGFDLGQTRDFIKTVVGPNGEFSHWDGWGVGSGAWVDTALARNFVTVLKEAPWPEKTFTDKEEARPRAPWLKVKSRTQKKGPNKGQKVYRRPFQHLHVFAVSGPQRLPFYAWLGKYVDRFTTDSTQWLQGVKYNRYLALMPNGQLVTYPMGRERMKQEYISTGVTPVDGAPLPCACPVCRILPVWDVFKLPAKFRIYALLGWHNIWVTHRMTDMWAANAELMDEETFRDEVAYVQGEEAHFTLDWIERLVHGDLTEVNESERMLFAFAKDQAGEVNSILPGKKGEDPNDPVTQLGAANMMLGKHAPSHMRTTISNYLSKEEIEGMGLEYHPPTKDRKRPVEKKKPRKRYVYQQPKREDYETAITAWLETDAGKAFEGCDITYKKPGNKKKGTPAKVVTEHIGPEDVIKALSNGPARKAFVKLHKIKMKKAKKLREVVLKSDEEHQKERELKHKRQGSRYKRKKVKRKVRKKSKKKSS